MTLIKANARKILVCKELIQRHILFTNKKQNIRYRLTVMKKSDYKKSHKIVKKISQNVSNL